MAVPASLMARTWKFLKAACALRQGVSTGHAIGFARDVTRLLRSEEDVDRRQLCRLSGSTQQRVPPKFGDFLRRLPSAHLEGSPHRAGRHGVDADAFGRDLLGEGLGESNNRGLG